MLRPMILVFAKYPEPGRVNTRLCPPLSPAQAAEVHLACLRHVWAVLADVGRLNAVLVVTPDDRVDEMRTVVAGAPEVWPQGPGSLGDRLERASGRVFRSGAPAVIFLGTDSPTTVRAALGETRKRLEHSDAVIGPCDDGGYYLLAVRDHQPDLFRGIDWGTHRVADQTRDRAAAAGLLMQELPVGYDIDRFDDLQRTLHDLEVVDPQCPLAGTIRGVLAEPGAGHG